MALDIMQQKWIRLVKPNGSTHIVPASNKAFYLKHNASLLMGPEPRPDLQIFIQDLTPEENEAENRRILDEGTAQSKKSRKLRDAALAASVAVSNNGGNQVSQEAINALIQQNNMLIEQLKNVNNGKKTRKAEAV